MDAARDERSRALKAMNAQIKSRNDSIAKLKREAASLEKLVADLRRAMSDLPPTGGQAFEKVRGPPRLAGRGQDHGALRRRRAAAASSGTAS